MDGKWLVDFFNKPARYPHHIVRGDGSRDPVHIGDLNRVIEAVSRLIDQLKIPEFAIRSENWSGLIVVYGMDEPESRGRLRDALEKNGFEVRTPLSANVWTPWNVSPRARFLRQGPGPSRPADRHRPVRSRRPAARGRPDRAA
ncbi:hypothetical protein [Streptomyces sp. NPDC006384]|uniref:hypothetical protein n=1 Tax=Streptomyces sp. NPDC006384 TaxID=3364745 RepID=UPI0036B4771B